MSIVNYMNKLPVLMLQNTPYKQRINYQTLFVVLNMPAYRTMRTEAKHQDNKLPINSKVLCICFFVVVVVLCTVPYVANFSGLSIFDCPLWYSLKFMIGKSQKSKLVRTTCFWNNIY